MQFYFFKISFLQMYHIFLLNQIDFLRNMSLPFLQQMIQDTFHILSVTIADFENHKLILENGRVYFWQ